MNFGLFGCVWSHSMMLMGQFILHQNMSKSNIQRQVMEFADRLPLDTQNHSKQQEDEEVSNQEKVKTDITREIRNYLNSTSI